MKYEESVTWHAYSLATGSVHTYSRHDLLHLFLADAKSLALAHARTRTRTRIKDTRAFHIPTIESIIIVCFSVLIGWGGCEVSPWLFSVIMAFDNTGYKHHCHTPQLRRTTDWPSRKTEEKVTRGLINIVLTSIFYAHSLVFANTRSIFSTYDSWTVIETLRMNLWTETCT